MQAIFIVNGVQVHPWIAEGGISQSDVLRQDKSMTDLNGDMYRTNIVKRSISITLVELRDRTWFSISAALAGRPCEVEYLDDDKGRRTALFYVTAKSGGTKTVRGGITYYSGCTFSLEER